MTKKSKFKRLLVLVIALIAISVSVLIVNAAQTDKQVDDTQNQTEVTEATATNKDSNISTYFHEVSGTLIVSGEGPLNRLYPRDHLITGEQYPFPSEIIKIDTSVKHLIIEEGITHIGDSFNDLHSLETISLPDSLKSIHNSFIDCDKLSTIVLPKNITKINTGFWDCDGIEDICFLGDKVTIYRSFTNLDLLKKIIIPDGSDLSSSFNKCENLEKVYLGADVSSDGRYSDFHGDYEYSAGCFYDCSENLLIAADEKKEAYYRIEYSGELSMDYIGEDYYDNITFAYYSLMPEKLEATNETDGIRLDWDTKINVDTYHIYRKANGENKWTKIADTRANTYTDKTVKSGKTYTYMLKTDDNTGSVTAEKNFIATPELVNAYNTTTNTVKIKWNKVDGAVKYRVYRSAYDMHGNRTWERLGDTTTNIFEDKTAKSNERYCYTVRAFGKSEYSGYDSEGVSVKFLRMPKVTSVSNAVDGVKVTVNSPEGGADVYRKTTGGNWDFIGYTSSSVFVDKTAKSGVTYTYTARKNLFDNRDDTWHRSAYDTKGKTIKYLETPEISSATSTKAGVKLEWNKITGASGYKIYRKTGNGDWGEAIATVKGNSTVTYVDKTAKKGVTYTYTVRAYNGSTKSGYIAEGKTVKDKY